MTSNLLLGDVTPVSVLRNVKNFTIMILAMNLIENNMNFLPFFHNKGVKFS